MQDITPDIQLRESELEAALSETQRDIAAGRVHHESVDDHIQRITT
jgi:hypothetical protein